MTAEPTTDMDAQEILAKAFLDRLSRADTPSELCVATVIRDLDVVEFMLGTLEFVSRIPANLRDPWYRAFTRTLFFAGNPAHLGARFAPDYLSNGGTIAWLGPAERRTIRNLSRMLRLFQAERAPQVPTQLVLTMPGLPETGRTADLRIAVTGMSTAQYLVQVHHALSEAVLGGLLRGVNRLRVRHIGELDPGEAIARQDTLLRIAEDVRHPRRLRLYACLDVTQGQREGY